MKRSILLALAIGISSCSSRSHDITSNRTFSMTCDAAAEHTEFPSPHIVAIVNPQLPQAMVRIQVKKDIWKEEIWTVLTIDSTLIALNNPEVGGYGSSNPLQIDRKTRRARLFYTGYSPEIEDLTNCTFNSL